jgi:PelA/Pel-15E family pectate lyase
METMKLKRQIIAWLLALGIASVALAYTSASKHLDHPDEWYRGAEAKKIADAVLSFHSPRGGWPKNIDTATQPYAGPKENLDGTFDNGATTFELRFLARMATATGEERYKEAFAKGLDHVLEAQYPNGGWPQYYPPGDGYNRYITFNDGAMARLMFFVRDVAKDEKIYGFVDPARREKCKAAWDKGVDCILKCQVKVDGKPTVWCAQHDEKDLSPKPARAFEPVSLSGSESIGLVHVLMAVEKPSPEVVAAVDAVKEYFDKVKLPGIKVEDRPQEGTVRGYERFVVEDPSAPPMWARFYEIGTNKPIFSDRDSVIKYKLSDIGIERRTGYKWLGYWPKNFLEKEYPEWKAKLAQQPAAQ